MANSRVLNGKIVQKKVEDDMRRIREGLLSVIPEGDPEQIMKTKSFSDARLRCPVLKIADRFNI